MFEYRECTGGRDPENFTVIVLASICGHAVKVSVAGPDKTAPGTGARISIIEVLQHGKSSCRCNIESGARIDLDAALSHAINLSIYTQCQTTERQTSSSRC